MGEDSGKAKTLEELARIVEELKNEQELLIDRLGKIFMERKRMDDYQWYLITQLLTNRAVPGPATPSLKVRIAYSEPLRLTDISHILLEVQKAGDLAVGEETDNSNYKSNQDKALEQWLGMSHTSRVQKENGHVPLRIRECHTGHSIEFWIQVIMSAPTATYSIIRLYKLIKKYMGRRKEAITEEIEEIEEIEITVEYST